MSDSMSNSTDPAKAGEVAQKIVGILAAEDSATRRRAISAALMLLGESPVVESKSSPLRSSEGDELSESMQKFFERDGELKPSDGAFLCAAYFYSLYGAVSFSLDELRSIASEAGIVLPGRVDVTIKGAAKDGKKLFQSSGKNNFKPTAAAGLMFREKWNVRPGKQSKLSGESK